MDKLCTPFPATEKFWKVKGDRWDNYKHSLGTGVYVLTALECMALGPSWLKRAPVEQMLHGRLSYLFCGY